jgi:hypothetical protein
MWINTASLAVYRTHAEIRAAFPNTSFPSVISEAAIQSAGLTPLVIAVPPAHDAATQTVEETAPVQIDGVWTQQWLVRDKSEEEQAAYARELTHHIATEAQARLDTWARSRGYDGILSACTYATSQVPRFQAEGQRCVDLRDQTWARLYEILAEVEAGTRPVPLSLAEIEGDLPALAWAD